MAGNNSAFTPEMTRTAEEVYEYLFQKLKRFDGIHVGTFVAAAARIAIMGFIEGCKTVPAPLKSVK